MKSVKFVLMSMDLLETFFFTSIVIIIISVSGWENDFCEANMKKNCWNSCKILNADSSVMPDICGWCKNK